MTSLQLTGGICKKVVIAILMISILAIDRLPPNEPGRCSRVPDMATPVSAASRSI